MDIRNINAGDRLLVRSDLIDGAYYGRDGIADHYIEGECVQAFEDSMKFAGKVVTVDFIDEGFYIATEEGVDEKGYLNCWFAPTMFECHESEIHQASVIEDKSLYNILGF